jgi:hypothetical protein
MLTKSEQQPNAYANACHPDAQVEGIGISETGKLKEVCAKAQNEYDPFQIFSVLVLTLI